jgi:hypothetical protein
MIAKRAFIDGCFCVINESRAVGASFHAALTHNALVRVNLNDAAFNVMACTRRADGDARRVNTVITLRRIEVDERNLLRRFTFDHTDPDSLFICA